MVCQRMSPATRTMNETIVPLMKEEEEIMSTVYPNNTQKRHRNGNAQLISAPVQEFEDASDVVDSDDVDDTDESADAGCSREDCSDDDTALDVSVLLLDCSTDDSLETADEVELADNA